MAAPDELQAKREQKRTRTCRVVPNAEREERDDEVWLQGYAAGSKRQCEINCITCFADGFQKGSGKSTEEVWNIIRNEWKPDGVPNGKGKNKDAKGVPAPVTPPRTVPLCPPPRKGKAKGAEAETPAQIDAPSASDTDRTPRNDIHVREGKGKENNKCAGKNKGDTAGKGGTGNSKGRKGQDNGCSESSTDSEECAAEKGDRGSRKGKGGAKKGGFSKHGSMIGKASAKGKSFTPGKDRKGNMRESQHGIAKHYRK